MRQRVHVRGLALVGRHAGGGVALDVLDRAEAFARAEPQILGGDVVLEIDEGLAAAEVRSLACVAADGVTAHRAGDREAFAASGPRLRRPHSLRPGIGEVEAAVACAGRPLRLQPKPSGRNAPSALVEPQLAARLREQMHRRRPAAAHQQRDRTRWSSPFDSVAPVAPRSRPRGAPPLCVPATNRQTPRPGAASRCAAGAPDRRSPRSRRLLPAARVAARIGAVVRW